MPHIADSGWLWRMCVDGHRSDTEANVYRVNGQILLRYESAVLLRLFKDSMPVGMMISLHGRMAAKRVRFTSRCKYIAISGDNHLISLVDPGNEKIKLSFSISEYSDLFACNPERSTIAVVMGKKDDRKINYYVEIVKFEFSVCLTSFGMFDKCFTICLDYFFVTNPERNNCDETRSIFFWNCCCGRSSEKSGTDDQLQVSSHQFNHL